jgi:phage tail sheath protein FI
MLESKSGSLTEMVLSDAIGRGITVTEIAPKDQPVDVPQHTTAAFIGRALCGPLNTPVLLDSFAAFCRRFGGLWLRSSLGPAVQQFFEHGGKRLYVVRVANRARGAMICLPASHGVLVLRALEPGSTESIRAAVDYDGISDDEHFNLTLQRTAPESGLVMDQEIYLRISCKPGSRKSIADVLANSSLVRASTPLPPGRPASTSQPGVSFDTAYVGHAQDGYDGTELTDYDLIGSATRKKGLFALNTVDHFDLLYMPPPARHGDIGAAAILAADLYCRSRGSMLITDPPESWDSAESAVAGVRGSGMSSPNILSYFPRVIFSGDPYPRPRVAGGAVAGLLCKLDRLKGAWEELDQPGFGFDRKLTPSLQLNVDEAQRLVREGVNVISGRLVGHATLNGSVTLGCRGQTEKIFGDLTARRLCLMVTNTIDQATRWAVFEPDRSGVADRVQAQVHAYMCALAAAGAFADDDFVVQCDAGLQAQTDQSQRGVTVFLAFQPSGAVESVSLTLHQTPSGCRVATTAFAPVIEDCA